MVSPIEPVPSVEAPATAAAPARRPVRRRVVSAPPPSAERTLLARSRQVLGAGTRRPPDQWLLPGFARDVDLVRRQLGPLHDRRMLVASYERESTRLAALRRLVSDPSGPPPAVDPIEAAYAVRWLELADGAGPLPPWSSIVGAPADSGG